MGGRESLSVILPAKNEATSLVGLIEKIRKLCPEAEVLVIDDGSVDDSARVATEAGATVISHPYSMGNGAAVKTGARRATGNVLVFLDADGQHEPDDIPALIEKLENGYEMAVGARSTDTHATFARRLANGIYNRLASFMTGQRVVDLTSGFRAARARHFRKFLYLLPNGFSYPTTSTLAFFRSGLPVAYVPVRARSRKGKSHIHLIKDGVRFFVIILKIGTLFSPMRLFLPVSGTLFLTGVFYYLYTYITTARFTNMGALLFLSSLLTFLIGIVSEQISSLHYKGMDQDARRVKRDK